MDALFDQDLRGLFAIVGAVLIAWSLKRAVSRLSKGRQGENRVRRVLKAGGFACAHDLLLPTGEKDGWTQIDHVVALPGRLVSIETKTMSGHIYASEGARHWMQFVGRQKHRFQNPLHQNFKHLMAIRKVVGNAIPVAGLVVFAGRAKFPKGLPGGCCHLAGLPEELFVLRGMGMGAPAAPILDRLKLASSQDRPTQEASQRPPHKSVRTAIGRQLIAAIAGGGRRGFSRAAFA